MEGKSVEDTSIGQHESGESKVENLDNLLQSKLDKTEAFVQNYIDELGLNIKAVGFIKEENFLGSPVVNKKLCIRLDSTNGPMADMFFNLDDYQSLDAMKEDLMKRLLGAGQIKLEQKPDNETEPNMAG